MFAHWIKKLWQAVSRPKHDRNSERRDSPRFDASVFTRYRGCGMFVERRANLSLRGCCFEGESEYAVGANVELLFKLPNSTRFIPARAVVLGHTQSKGWFGVRCRFKELNFNDERLLARWLDHMANHQRFQAA